MARDNGTGGPRPRVRLSEATEAVQAALDNLQQAQDEEDDDGVHVHVHMGGDPPVRTTDRNVDDDLPITRTLDAETEERISSIEGGLLELHSLMAQVAEKIGVTPPKTTTTQDGDSTALQTSFMQFVSQAEILVPGYKVATFDSALPRAKTIDAMCAGRRQVLTLLGATTDGAALLKNVTEDGFDVANAPCDVVAIAFKSAAAVKGAANNRSTTGDRMGVPSLAAAQNVAPAGGMKRVSDADINAANAKYWSEQNRSA